MNHNYGLVWNRATRRFQVTSELACGRGKQGRSRCGASIRSTAWLIAVPLTALAGSPPTGVRPNGVSLPANVLPTGGTVTAGNGTVTQSGNTLTVSQQSQNLSLNWLSFNVGSQATVNFVQPGASAIAVNRILGTDGSQIYGHLNANGQVFLIDPNGVLFGPSAQVNVGGLVASTLDVSDSALGSGSLVFSGNASGSVVNQGTITAAKGGYVALLGNTVINQGAIHAQLGSVALAGGSAVTLSFDGGRLAGVEVDQSTLNNLVKNGQLIETDGGSVWLTAGARDSLLASAVNNSGVIDAGSVSTDGGVVKLLANDGTVTDSGRIDVSGVHGGTAQVLSDQEASVSGTIDASGTQGGGTIRVGGGYQGGQGLPTANVTNIAPTAYLNADATQSGNGGTVVAWGNEVNNFEGIITARGGALAGNGGLVETSAHYGLNAQGEVDASAPHGTAGTWLLDPYDVTITNSTSGNVSVSGNTYTASGIPSVINSTTLGNALTGGTNVFVFTNTQAMGAENGDITVASPITAAGSASLYLEAAGSIFVNSSISAASSSNPLNVYLWANYGGSAAGTTYSHNAVCASSTGCQVNTTGLITTQGGSLDIEAADAEILVSGGIDAGGGNISIGNGGGTPYNTELSGVVTGNSLAVNTLYDIGLQGAVTTTGSQTYDGPVTLQGDVTLTANGAGGGITFGSTLDSLSSTQALTVNAGGNTVAFQGAVGSLGSLGSLVSIGSGPVVLDGNVSAVGVQSYTGEVQLGQNTTVLAGSSVTLASGVLGSNLIITGNAAFSGTTTLASLAVNGNSTLSGSIVTSGTQQYSSAVTLNGATTLQSVGPTGSITFGGTVGGVGESLNIEAISGPVAFDGAVGGAGALNSLTTESSTFLAGALNIGPGGLVVTTTGGPISQTGSFSVLGPSSFNAGASAITLNGANDFVGAVTLTGGNTEINNVVPLTLGFVGTGSLSASSVGSLDLGSGVVSGNLNAVSSGNAEIVQGGALAVLGTSTINAGTGTIILTNGTNNFVSAVSLAGGNTQIANGTALILGDLAILNDGNLSVTSNGALNLGSGSISGNLVANSQGNPINQTSALSVSGTSNINAGTAAITLNSSGNIFGGAVTLTGGVTQLTATNDLVLGVLNTGDLTVSSGGALNLGSGLVAGALTASSDGAMTEGSGLTVTGAATFTQNSTTTGTSQDIVLGSPGNDFQNGVTFAAAGGAQINNLTLANSDAAPGSLTLPAAVAGNFTLDYSNAALTLPPVSVGGALNVTAAGGGITIDSNVTTGGSQTYNSAVTLGGNITLQSTGGGNIDLVSTVDSPYALTLNTGGAATLSGSAQLTGLNSTSGTFNAEALTIGSGGLSVTTTAGGITQGGAFTVTGSSDFNAGSNAITLTNSGNNFANAVSLTGGTTQITNDTGLNLGALDTGSLSALSNGVLNLGAGTVSGNLTANSQGGAIGQTGALTVTGSSNIQAGTSAITLAQSGNRFTGPVSLTGGPTQVSASGSLTLGTLNTGDLTVSSGGTLNLGNGLVAGALTASSDGAMSEGSGLTVTGAASFTQNSTTAGTSQDIVLGSPGNDFQNGMTFAAGSGAQINNLTLANSDAAPGSLTLPAAVAGNFTLDYSNAALTLPPVSVGGALNVTAGGGITIDGNVTTGGSQTYNSAVTLGGNVTLQSTGGGNIDLVSTVDASYALALNTGGAVTLNGSAQLTGLTSTSGSFNAGALTIGNAGLSLTTTAGGITQGGAFTVTGSSDFNAGSNAVTLTNSSNNFAGVVNLTGGATQITNGAPLALGTVSTGNLAAASNGALNLGSGMVAGNLAANSQGGAIDQAGALSVSGTSNINAGSGAITLIQGGNNFTGPVALTGGVTQVTASNALTLGALSTGDLTVSSGGALNLGGGLVGGALTASSNGTMTGGGGLTVTGTASFTQDSVTAGNSQDILLGNTGNSFQGDVIFTAGNGARINNLTLANSAAAPGTLSLPSAVAGNLTLDYANAALTVPSVVVGGALDVTAAGGITVNSSITTGAAQTYNSAVTLGGNATLQSTDGGAIDLASTVSGPYTLSIATGGAAALNGSAQLTGLIIASGSFNADALDIGSAGLSVSTTAGGIAQGGAFTVTGSSEFSAAGNAITLTNSGNNFVGPVSLTGGATQITNSSALTLGAINTGNLAASSDGALGLGSGSVAGNLTASSQGGAIGQSGALSVSGISNIDAGTGVITLANSANNFTGTVTLAGGVTELASNQSLVLGSARVSTLTVQTSQDITLAAGSSLTASGTGAALVLADGGRFTNNSGSAALQTPNGSWQIWSQDPANDTLGGLAFTFKQYHASFGTTAVQGQGDGVLYTLAPKVTVGLTGSVDKVYDGTTVATLSSGNYTVSGLVGTDTASLNEPTRGNYDSAAIGNGKGVTVSGLILNSVSDGATPVYGYQLADSTVDAAIGSIAPVLLSVPGVAYLDELLSPWLVPVAGASASDLYAPDVRVVGTGVRMP